MAHQQRTQIYMFSFKDHLFCNSTAHFSSASRNSSSVHNYYIRKRRKWPIRPYKEQWLQTFATKLAKQSFKQSIRNSRTDLLCDLIKSFAAYEIQPSPQSYHLLFKILIQKRPSNWNDQLRQILDHIEKVEDFETPECVFIDLIKFYGESNMLNDALELFFRIPKFRCEPSVGLLNALLSVLCRNQTGVEIVPRVLILSQEMNIRLEKSSFGILIRALCRIGNMRNALIMLNQMVDEGFDVDQRACSLMLATLCRQEDCNGDEIMGILDNLKRLGFEPKFKDFRNMMWLLVRKGKGLDALEILKQMKISGIKPDIASYRLVLDGLIHNREFNRAEKVFDELLVSGLVPDIHTYNVYISGLCMQKKVEDGITMLGSMEELGCPPDSKTYNTILRALCEAGKLDRMKEMATAMRHKNFQLNSHLYESMIDGYDRWGNSSAANNIG